LSVRTNEEIVITSLAVREVAGVFVGLNGVVATAVRFGALLRVRGAVEFAKWTGTTNYISIATLLGVQVAGIVIF